ncbi:HEAT repeat domain-containing protein [uncultured Gimesia sp.]|uniref:HEAT repeat domain-containing protein n=1 Tax=uncultured Gimesia sp. TaxID=1678688 RepID=UPI0026393B66|nr:HEAT repeat domain-containing protein [uncultured Gimesia sp.]
MAFSEKMNKGEIDWTELARTLGALDDDGREHGSSIDAREAIAMILGPTHLRNAVDHYVRHKKGGELVRNVLWLLRPWSAMERCYEIYQTDDDPEARCTAIELLRVVADRRVLPWIKGFLEDSDKGVQSWAAGIVDQLLWSDLVDPEDCAELLQLMANHSNRLVLDRYSFIINFLNEREIRLDKLHKQ